MSRFWPIRLQSITWILILSALLLGFACTSGAEKKSPIIQLVDIQLECFHKPPTNTIVLQPKHLRRVRGITRSINGEVLSQVKVILVSQDEDGKVFLERTDESGAFEFYGVGSGRYRLLTCHKGWDEYNFEVILSAQGDDEFLFLDLPLSS